MTLARTGSVYVCVGERERERDIERERERESERICMGVREGALFDAVFCAFTDDAGSNWFCVCLCACGSQRVVRGREGERDRERVNVCV